MSPGVIIPDAQRTRTVAPAKPVAPVTPQTKQPQPSSPLPSNIFIRQEQESEWQPIEESRQVEVPTQLFGPKVSYYNPATGVMTEQLTSRQGEKVFVEVKPATAQEIWGGKASLSPHTQSAVSGLGLSTVVATGVALPVVGATGIAAVGVGEGVKRGLTGKDLTLEEAISVAGIGELTAVTALSMRQALQPKIQTKIDASYRKAIESQKLYKPSLAERLYMKMAGVKPTRLASELVGAGESPPISFKMLQKGTVSADQEAYFWDSPTPRSSEVYVAKVIGSRAKMWAGERLINRVSGGLSYALIQQEITQKVEPKLPYIPREPEIRNVQTPSIKPFIPIITTSPKTSTTQRSLTLAKPKSVQRLQQALKQKQSQKSASAQVFSQTQSVEQSQRAKHTTALTSALAQPQKTAQRTQTVNQLIAKTTDRKLYPSIPNLGSGGQAKRSSGFNLGKWHFKRHPVATFDQNLRSILGKQGGSPRLMRKTRLTKTVKLGKGVSVKMVSVKRKSKRKRKG